MGIEYNLEPKRSKSFIDLSELIDHQDDKNQEPQEEEEIGEVSFAVHALSEYEIDEEIVKKQIYIDPSMRRRRSRSLDLKKQEVKHISLID